MPTIGPSFAIWYPGVGPWLASKDGYEDSVLPTGDMAGRTRIRPRYRLRPLPGRPDPMGMTPRQPYEQDHLVSLLGREA